MAKRKEILEYHKKQKAVCLSNIFFSQENNAICLQENSGLESASVDFDFMAPPYTDIPGLDNSPRFVERMKLVCVSSGPVKQTRFGKKVKNFAMMDESGNFVRLEAWNKLVNSIRDGFTYLVNKVEKCHQVERPEEASDEEVDEDDSNENEDKDTRVNKDENDGENEDDENTAINGDKADLVLEKDKNVNKNQQNKNEDDANMTEDDDDDPVVYIRTMTNTELKNCDSINIDDCQKVQEEIQKIISYNSILEVSGEILGGCGTTPYERYKRCPGCFCKVDVNYSSSQNTVTCSTKWCRLENSVKSLEESLRVRFKFRMDNGDQIKLTCFNEVLDNYFKKSSLKMSPDKIWTCLRKNKQVMIEYNVNKGTVQSITKN